MLISPDFACVLFFVLETDAVSDNIIEYGLKLQRIRKDKLPKFITVKGDLKRVAGVMFEPSDALLQEPGKEQPEPVEKQPDPVPAHEPEPAADREPDPAADSEPDPAAEGGPLPARRSARKPAPNASDATSNINEPIASDSKLFLATLVICNACCCCRLSQMKTKERAKAKARANENEQIMPIPNAPPSAKKATITMTVTISLLLD